MLRIDWTNQRSLLENTSRQLDEVKRETELHIKTIELHHTEKAQDSEAAFIKKQEVDLEQIKVGFV